MFGLAIWDARKERLVIARDPFGIKLIYYKLDTDSVYFGSEIRAVAAGTNESAEIDPSSVNLFLRYRSTPSPYTVFKSVRKLASGTILTFEKASYNSPRCSTSNPTPL